MSEDETKSIHPLDVLVERLLHCAIGHGNPLDFTERYFQREIAAYEASQVRMFVDRIASLEKERDAAHGEVSALVSVILEAYTMSTMAPIDRIVRIHNGFPVVDFDLVRANSAAAKTPASSAPAGGDKR